MPRVAGILRALKAHRVDWIMSGSSVLAVYGAEIAPNDLDVVPASDAGNLERLAGLLSDINAIPVHEPDWESSPSIDECLQWTPDPATAEHLDHQFVTDLGLLDLPFAKSGTYQELLPSAERLKLSGVEVLVCDPDEVLARLPDPPRRKDRRRAIAYEQLRNLARQDRQARDLTYWPFPPMP